MKKLFAVYNSYTGQRGPDDCGLACLSMILNFAGRYHDGTKLMHLNKAPDGGLSLFDLRELAADNQLISRCVQMDLETLRNLNMPVILHVRLPDGNFHFVVFYYSRRYRCSSDYLIADPATGIAWYPEEDLCLKWTNGAALYFEDLRFGWPKPADQVWLALFRGVSFHKTLFISIPVLNLFITLLGAALSWLLQRGINDSPGDKKNSLLIAVMVLLGLIMVAKSVGTYLKQHLLIRLNSDIRLKYFQLLCENLNSLTDETAIRKGLADIQRIQNAVSALFGVLFSEGSLLAVLLGAIWYFEPVAGVILTVYMGLLCWMGIRSSAGLNWQQGVLNEMAASTEQAFFKVGFGDGRMSGLIEKQSNYTQMAKSLAGNIGRNSLLYECCGTLAVIMVLSLCIYHIRLGYISYNMLMTEVIISYFITILAPRICQVFPLITEGARLSRRFEN